MIKDLVLYTAPEHWGVLCIDCWHSNGSNNEFYLNVIEQLQKYKISAVVNCATNIKIDYRDKSVYNTLNCYLWHTQSDEQIKQKVLSNLINCAGSEPTAQILNEKLFTNTTVHISDIETFASHASKYYPGITHWIIVGSAWNICVHWGPMGVNKLINLPTHAFFVFPDWSVQDEHGEKISVDHLSNDNFIWAPIDNNGYELITKLD